MQGNYFASYENTLRTKIKVERAIESLNDISSLVAIDETAEATKLLVLAHAKLNKKLNDIIADNDLSKL